MKDFFNNTIASMCGTLLALVITVSMIGLIVIGGFFGIIALNSNMNQDIETTDHSILHLKFNESISDQRSVEPNFSTFTIEQKMGLYDILTKIKNAAEEDFISGIYLDLSSLHTGLATIEDIRSALIEFKKSGKFIVAHSEYYSHSTYYLASVADKIYLTPAGGVEFTGLSSNIVFFKSLFDKIGVKPIVIRHGKFKSAVEPFLQDVISDANREQTQKYVNSLWTTILKGIEDQRDIPEAKLNYYADALLIKNDLSALEYKLVDGLKYKDEVFAELKKLSNSDQLNLLPLKYYNQVPDFSYGSYGDEIAVIYATGSIVSGEGNEDMIGSESLSELIRSARENSSVKAIVLRVNSPGGSALASEVIWRETVLAQKAKPLIVSFGDVAASGGYYIACAADAIVAEPNTITGSIGVFGVLFNTKDIMTKFGVNVNTIRSNKFSDIANPTRPITDWEKSVLQDGVEEVYETFVKHVAEGRKTTFSAIDKIAQGRVWTGTDAKEIGLVDQLGGLNDAIVLAAEKAFLKRYQVISYPEQNKLTAMIHEALGGVKVSVLSDELGDAYHIFKQVNELKTMKGVQARLPYFYEFNN